MSGSVDDTALQALEAYQQELLMKSKSIGHSVKRQSRRVIQAFASSAKWSQGAFGVDSRIKLATVARLIDKLNARNSQIILSAEDVLALSQGTLRDLVDADKYLKPLLAAKAGDAIIFKQEAQLTVVGRPTENEVASLERVLEKSIDSDTLYQEYCKALVSLTDGSDADRRVKLVDAINATEFLRSASGGKVTLVAGEYPDSVFDSNGKLKPGFQLTDRVTNYSGLKDSAGQPKLSSTTDRDRLEVVAVEWVAFAQCLASIRDATKKAQSLVTCFPGISETLQENAGQRSADLSTLQRSCVCSKTLADSLPADQNIQTIVDLRNVASNVSQPERRSTLAR